MPEICRFYGILIKMYYNDHQPPHFHAEYGAHRIEVMIDTMEIRQFGKFPKRAISLIIEWAVLHRTELLENWKLARDGKELKKIKPLV